MQIFAPAKLNLSLRILGKRPDGYHNLDMTMQTLDWGDVVTLDVTDGDGITVMSDNPALPQGIDNLAGRAAQVFLQRTDRRANVRIHIAKTIPAGAGLGGGSANAAAVLRGMNAIFGGDVPLATLADWGLAVGSDVPFCVVGGHCRAEGRGERLTPLPPLEPCAFLLCLPEVHVSTREAYARADDLPNIDPIVLNDFEPSVIAVFPVIGEILQTLRDAGAKRAQMSGSGSACFGVFADVATAERAQDTLNRFGRTAVTRPDNRLTMNR